MKDTMYKHSISVLAFAAAAWTASAGELPPDTPLVTGKHGSVKAIDFEAAMQKIPETYRAPIRMSQDKISTMVDGLFVAKSFSGRAREAGMDKDPLVQERLRQAQDQILADLYLRKLETDAKIPPLEQRAREIYNADAKKFTLPEQVRAQQILVTYAQRTPEMALARAKELEAQVRKPGQDFLALAKEFSEDPARRRNGGELGYNDPTSFEPEIVEWLKTAKDANTVSPPIQTRHGYHIVKFIDRQPPRRAPFEQVKAKIIEGERAEIIKKIRDDAINAERNDPAVVIHAANVEALRIEVDADLLTRTQQGAPLKTPGTLQPPVALPK
ncbi:Chaperone SurA [Usitatibacter rugosus]|uniref:peptidylprolyl isomerase n=1 Tax=Usitatibacter rugosus TaxID=2732067 RepID=A0A6M4GZM8_9PROT|nr:peptidylprolyl isomerase [Usitatibacter rugosus]QJR12701.1 Chaperone SurA [Usitatibacter rugosus]